MYRRAHIDCEVGKLLKQRVEKNPLLSLPPSLSLSLFFLSAGCDGGGVGRCNDLGSARPSMKHVDNMRHSQRSPATPKNKKIKNKKNKGEREKRNQKERNIKKRGKK